MTPPAIKILFFFEYEHLPPRLGAISREFWLLAHSMAGKLEGPELTAGLRKLLEAKDCMVRAALDAGGETVNVHTPCVFTADDFAKLDG